MFRIIYNTTTGKIETCRSMSDKILQLQLKQGTNLDYINGYVQDYGKHKVDLETLQVVEQADPTTGFNLQRWMRQRRDNKLLACDWTVGADSPLTESKKTEWQTYRQALRDVPANNTSAENREDVVWPTPPGA